MHKHRKACIRQSVVVYLEGSVPTQWEVGVKILKHLCVPVTKVQAHLLSTFSIELIAIVLTVNRCVRCLVDCDTVDRKKIESSDYLLIIN